LGALRFGGHPQTPSKGALPLWTPLLLKDLFEEKVYKCLFNPLNLPVLVDFGKWGDTPSFINEGPRRISHLADDII
jgi:hypothetical protein